MSRNKAKPTEVYSPGDDVAFNHPQDSWVAAQVVEYREANFRYDVRVTSTQEVEKGVNFNDVYRVAPELLEEAPHELLTMTELHESTLLSALRTRFHKDWVYTNIGNIVVALNPWNYNIPWYKEERMGDYIAQGKTPSQDILPHTWALAHQTYHELVESKENHTIIVSGESGAGKTEAAKMVVKYVSALTDKIGKDRAKQGSSPAAEGKISKAIQQASPILESFGNAKTVRNDNSSRFGKFVRLQFGEKGELVGAVTEDYLLEKSRVVTAAKDERVYHAFYQLIAGAASRMELDPMEKFESLNSGKCTTITGVNDKENFEEVCQAMTDVGIDSSDQDGVWDTLAGILYLCNIKFEGDLDSSSVASESKMALERASRFFGVNLEGMERIMTKTISMVRNKAIEKKKSPNAAAETRDAIGKALYCHLFKWLVAAINATTDNSKLAQNWIGLLDIFGFESFETNSFEQLCINLANESLQSHYNKYQFEKETELYKMEGVSFEKVDFEDNEGCVKLIAAPKDSVFAILDDVCLTSSQTDEDFRTRVEEQFRSSKHYTPARTKSDNFTIRHYAGEVKYNCKGFLHKNNDPMSEEISAFFRESDNKFVAKLLPSAPAAQTSPKGKRKKFVSKEFREQLDQLMTEINATHPHWVRCINPHPMKRAKMFDGASVLRQLRSAGVLETVRIRKASYPVRMKHENFLRQFKLLIELPEGADSPPPQVGCTTIFKKAGILTAGGQIGKTQVFLKNPALNALNRQRETKAVKYLLEIQRLGKGYIGRDRTANRWFSLNKDRLEAEKLEKERLEEQRRINEAAEKRRAAEERRKRQMQEAKEQEEHAWIIQCCGRGYRARLAFRQATQEQSRARRSQAADAANMEARRQLDILWGARREEEKRWAYEREVQMREENRDRIRREANAARIRKEGERQAAKESEQRFERECLRQVLNHDKAVRRGKMEEIRRTEYPGRKERRKEALMDSSICSSAARGERASQTLEDAQKREELKREYRREKEEEYRERERMREGRRREMQQRLMEFQEGKKNWCQMEAWGKQRERVLERAWEAGGGESESGGLNSSLHSSTLSSRSAHPPSTPLKRQLQPPRSPGASDAQPATPAPYSRGLSPPPPPPPRFTPSQRDIEVQYRASQSPVNRSPHTPRSIRWQ